MRFVCVLIVCILAVASMSCSRPESNVYIVDANAATPAPSVETFTDANAALAAGNHFLDENQTDAAIEALKQAIALNPDLGEAHFKLGIAYALQERQQEQTGERLPGEVVDGGKQYKTRSDKAFEKAEEAFKKWLKDNPDDINAHYFLGLTYSKLNKDQDAEKEFKQAVKLKPDDTEYQTELGSVLIKLAQYYEAVTALKKAIELDGTNDRAAALLEDAEAGKKRVEFIKDKTNANQNTQVKNTAANANSTAGNTNSATSNRPPGNTRPAANTSGNPPRDIPRERVVPTPRKTPGRPN
jgi:tetratricopeptide (TPR) repeat protein